LSLINIEAAPPLLSEVSASNCVPIWLVLFPLETKTNGPCYYSRKELYRFYRILAGQSGRFAFGFPGARSDFLTITSTNREKAALLRAFAHVHLQQS
jgi:hypothetical protein